jgi:hypothetical protein
MLRWTTRLRDMLESMDYQVNDEDPSDALLDLWYTLREAEFVDQSTIAFPEDLDWETFVGFYRTCGRMNEGNSFAAFTGEQKSIELYNPDYDPEYCNLSPAMDREFTNELVRSFSGKDIDNPSGERIDVLWLSPDIFVTAFDLTAHSEDYVLGSIYFVKLCTHQDASNLICLYFYSTSIFETGRLDVSDVPLKFLQKITEPLPPDFFSFVHLYRDADAGDGRDQFPSSYFTRFFFMIQNEMHATSGCTDRRDKRVDLLLPPDLDEEELELILEHPFHPAMSLIFDKDSPFDESLSIDDANLLLRHSPYVRSVHIPSVLVDYHPRQESFAISESLRCVVLPLFGDMNVDRMLLDSLSLNRHIEQLELRLHSRLIDREDLRMIGHLFQRIFNDQCCITTLLIDFVLFSPSIDHQAFAKKFLKKARLDKLPTLGNLSFFNVSFGHTDEGERRQDPSMVSLPRVTKNLQRITKWDHSIAPHLLLNYYRENMGKALTSGLVSLAVQAINLGAVYCKTTHHQPRIMKIANAGLIFGILRYEVYSDAK